MTLREYTVTVNGFETTLQLDDDEAVAWGVKEPPPPRAKTPVDKASRKSS